jgi:hypothetical protein
MTADYWDPLSQAQRREELKRDRDCLMTRAESDAELLNQGRFKKEVATTVTGSAVPTYPQLPSGPWSGDNPVPPGDAIDQLGYDINAVEPVLEPSLPKADATPSDSTFISSVAAESREPGATEEVTALTTPVAPNHAAARTASFAADRDAAASPQWAASRKSWRRL